MKKLTVTQFAEKRIKAGIDVLDSRDFPQLPVEDSWVELLDGQGSFLAMAYFSQQHKGCGWVVSRRQDELNQAYFERLFRKAWDRRSAFHRDKSTTAYRIFNQDGDGLGGLTIDFYDGYVVFSWYNTFIYGLKDLLLAAFQTALPEITGAYEKIRFRQGTSESNYLYGKEAPAFFTILENGIRYQVFLNEGLMTGIFLDQHEVRRDLAQGLAIGKKVLNMFSYTAAFSVAAAVGGAKETTSVDLAKRSRQLSEAHFLANDLDLADHRLVVMDVFDYFRYAKRKGLTYDVIILDPPSFARNKKETFAVAKDYHKLVAASLEILAPQGLLVTSTNAANLSLEKFKTEIEKGFGQVPHRYEQTYRLPKDFAINKKDESSNYLKVFTIRTGL